MYALPSRPLLQDKSMKIGGSKDMVDNASDVGFSNSFFGGVEDDSSLNLWEEGE